MSYGYDNFNLDEIVENFKKKVNEKPSNLPRTDWLTVYGPEPKDVYTIRIIDGQTVVINKGI